MIGTVDFTGHEEMHDALLRYINIDKTGQKDFLIFDDANHKVRIIWGELSLWQKK